MQKVSVERKLGRRKKDSERMSGFNPNLVGDAVFGDVGVFTDTEPDDILAIGQLARILREVQNLTFVVGEGNLCKVGMMRTLLATLGLGHATVVGGARSSKDYPPAMIFAFGAPQSEATSDATAHIVNFLVATPSPLFIVLKPPRELLAVAAQYPALLAQVTLVMYGSFNIRVLGADKMALLQLVNTLVMRAIIYETFLATGEKNSLEKQSTAAGGPDIFALAEQNAAKPFWNGLLRSVELWNNHIIEDCLDSVIESAQALKKTLGGAWADAKKPKGRLERNWKVAQNIISAESKQMVMADCGLAAILVDTQPVPGVRGNLAFDGDYTKPAASETGRCFFPTNVGYDAVAALIYEQCVALNKIL
jgi:hypothetical protein